MKDREKEREREKGRNRNMSATTGCKETNIRTKKNETEQSADQET